MKKILSLTGLFFIFSVAYNQDVSEKKVKLPEILNNIDLLPKERLLLSPDGKMLCLTEENPPYRAFLVNIETGVIEKKIAINTYAPQMKWSTDGNTIIFFVQGYPTSFFALYNKKGELLKKIETALPVLNFQVDSNASEIMAVLYNLAESGADFSTDLTGAYLLPVGKKYNYKLCLFDVVKKNIKDSVAIQATYPRIESKYKGDWYILINQSDSAFQSFTECAKINFSHKKIITVGNLKELFVNESLLNIGTEVNDNFYLHSKTGIFKLNEKKNRFDRIAKVESIESSSSSNFIQPGISLVAGIKAMRWAENEILLINDENKAMKIDLKYFIPHRVRILGDSVLVLSFSDTEITIRKYAAFFSMPFRKPEIIIQNNINAESRFSIPGTEYLVAFNNESWQVTDASSQLIVHQQRDFENYGTKFTAAGNNPYIIKYTSDKAELIPIGKWKEASATIILQHPLLKEGNAMYSSMSELTNLAFNSTTSILSGLFKSNGYYYVAAWKLGTSYSPMYVIRIDRKKIPGDENSLMSIGTSPVLLTHIIFNMKEPEWQKANEEDILKRMQKLSKQIGPFTMGLLKSFDNYSWKYTIEKGKITGEFVYQDSIYGNLFIDLHNPSNSAYFCYKRLTGGFSNYRYIPYPKAGYGAWKTDLSDRGNVVTLSNLGCISLYDIKTQTNKLIPKENNEQNFDGNAVYFIEDKGLLISNTAWYDAVNLRPVRILSQTLYSDSAIYIPEKKLFIAHNGGSSEYVKIQLDNMSIAQAGEVVGQLQGYFIKDSMYRTFYPQKKYWVLAGRSGLGYDSSNKVSVEYMGRSFPSSLSGKINFIQHMPEDNAVLIGNTQESTFEYWDVLKEQLIFKLVIVDEKNFVIQGNAGYYYATPDALQHIGFLQNGEAIPAAFMDAGLNRPDKLLEGMFDTTDNRIKQLAAIYRKAAARVNKQKLSIVPGESPLVKISRPTNTLFKENEYTVKLLAEGNKTPVKYFTIQVNNMTIWDTTLLHPVHSFELTKKIQLGTGENQLVFMAKDVQGKTSVPVFQRVVYQPVAPVKSKIIVIAMAVNKYRDSTKNLKYAVKDGKDLLAAFRSIEGTEVVTDSLFDGDFIRENILKLKKKLVKTTIEDKVILTYSGHGMLDDSLNFYLATYNMDFSAPQKNGFSFSELEGLLADIPARKQLLLIDACNSGNILKEDIIPEKNKNLPTEVSIQSDTTAAARGLKIPVPPNVSLQQVMSQLFASSSSRSGTEVIAATAGNAFAYESPQWKNGVFTYSLLQAFHQNSDLDLNFDNQVSIKELKRFVYPKVIELTKGKQQPLSRYENPNYDWNLLPIRYD